MRTDVHTYITKLKVAFRNFANAAVNLRYVFAFIL